MSSGLDQMGSIDQLSHREAGDRLDHEPVLFCHRRWTMSRLKHNPDSLSGLDVLELYAFVHPARFAVPTAGGACNSPWAEQSSHAEDQTILMPVIANTCWNRDLLARKQTADRQPNGAIYGIGWLGCAPMVLHACGEDMPAAAPPNSRDGAIWTKTG